MTQTDALIAAARACLGTPFHHQGRNPQHGLDCVGLIIVACAALGIKIKDCTGYERRPDGKSLVAALLENGLLPDTSLEAGRLLLFRYDSQPQHVALATSTKRMIHSFAPAHKVVETEIGPYWRHRLVSPYRFPFLT